MAVPVAAGEAAGVLPVALGRCHMADDEVDSEIIFARLPSYPRSEGVPRI